MGADAILNVRSLIKALEMGCEGPVAGDASFTQALGKAELAREHGTGIGTGTFGAHEVYDIHVGTPFNFIYDVGAPYWRLDGSKVLQFSSGRDKFCALMQGYAKFASEALLQSL